jgi:hypothetical protein
MSRHNRERRRKAADALPPPNRVPVNLAQVGLRNIKSYGVASWCPTPDGSGPAEAVVLHLTIGTVEGDDLEIGLRLKSARAVDEMIAALERHRNDVWPGG